MLRPHVLGELRLPVQRRNLGASPGRFVLPCALACTALFVASAGCGIEAKAALPAPALEVHDGFWWTVMGEQSAAVANFGPTLETAEGRSRQWCLVVHLPGGPEPLSCVQGLVRLADSSPILAEGGTFRVELRPCAGCDWGEVTDDARIVATVAGIY